MWKSMSNRSINSLNSIIYMNINQKAKVIDVPLSILPSWGCIDTYSKIDSKNSVNVFHREVGISMSMQWQRNYKQRRRLSSITNKKQKKKKTQ